MPDDRPSVPSGWRLAKIDDLFKSWGGHTPAKANSAYWGDGLPWVSSRDVKQDRLNSTTHQVTDAAVAETGLKVCPPGTVLVVVRSGILAHSLPVAVTEVPVTINQDLKAFYSDEPLLNEWLAMFLRMSAQELLASSRRDGTTVQSIRYPLLKNTLIPVPPLGQRRTLIEQVQNALGALSEVPGHLVLARRAVERFRQAVLAAACSGRLTADWRDSQNLPAWEYSSAKDVCQKVQSGTTPKKWHDGSDGIAFLKVYNIVDQRINFDYRPQYISAELHNGAMSRAATIPGDVLMNIVGPPLGKVAVVTDQFPQWSINQAITLFRPSDRVTSEWLYIFLCSGISVRQILNSTRGTVGQVNISLSQCRNFTIPIPSIAEQGEIARRVHDFLTIGDQMLERIDSCHNVVDRTARAVLGKAFRGELVG